MDRIVALFAFAFGLLWLLHMAAGTLSSSTRTWIAGVSVAAAAVVSTGVGVAGRSDPSYCADQSFAPIVLPAVLWLISYPFLVPAAWAFVHTSPRTGWQAARLVLLELLVVVPVGALLVALLSWLIVEGPGRLVFDYACP